MTKLCHILLIIQIELDLDDGVKVNYSRFQGVGVPKDNGKVEIMDLLVRI